MDIFGVSGSWGDHCSWRGMIRDVTLGITLVRKPVYAAVAVLTSVLVFFLLYFKKGDAERKCYL